MNIGIVLSGGMAKGAYQVGALKALAEYIPPDDIKYISCASVGALNGYSFVTGKLEKAEQIWKEICGEQEKILITRILRGSFVQNSIEQIFDKEDVIKNDIYLSLLNMTKRTVAYTNLKKVNKELIPLYLKASVTLPVFNQALKINGSSFFDGALIDNIPVFPLLKQKLDYIVCIYFDDCCYKFEDTYFDNKIIKITFPINTIVKESLVFKKNNIEEMINQGYKTASYILKLVFSKGIEDIDYIYDCIEYLNGIMGEKQLRITGDVVVTNFNKVTSKLARKKIIV